MRSITKGTAHYQLQQRHQNPLVTAEAATAAWNNFHSDRKAGTRQKCMEEQYGLCGYSEVSLNDRDPVMDAQGQMISRSLGVHLEHVEPKSRAPARTFDHANLIACAIDDGQVRGLVRQDLFGGHAKGSWFHAEGFVHPLLGNCRDYFHYEGSGKVVPQAGLPRREQAKARLTIHHLNLNAPVLVVWRRTWLQEAERIIDQLLDDEEALRQFAEVELSPVNGCLRPFHSAQRALFGTLGEQVCE